MRILLLALVVGACAQAPEREPETATLTVRALYIEPMYQGEALMANHEAIAGRMPAMRMPFRVYAPGLLDGLTPGTPVELTLDSVSLVVVAVQQLPPDTDLNLTDSGDDGRGVVILPPTSEAE